VAWVFFRADSLPQAVQYVAALFGSARGDGIEARAVFYISNDLLLALIVGIVGSTPVVHLLRRLREQVLPALNRRARVAVLGVIAAADVAASAAVLGYSLMLSAAETYNPFIYFRF
jgi:alginate O-acetyltransferase complex protein AlgI